MGNNRSSYDMHVDERCDDVVLRNDPMLISKKFTCSNVGVQILGDSYHNGLVVGSSLKSRIPYSQTNSKFISSLKLKVFLY